MQDELFCGGLARDGQKRLKPEGYEIDVTQSRSAAKVQSGNEATN